MSDWFPQPNITNYTGIIDYVNIVTRTNPNVPETGIFGPSVIWLIFIVALSGQMAYGHSTLKSIMVASYISWVMSILMNFLNWVPNYMVIIFAVMDAASTMLSFYRKKEPWE